MSRRWFIALVTVATALAVAIVAVVITLRVRDMRATAPAEI